MRRVPQKAVLRTEYPFCTGNACFLHRMPQKMRRVPQEAFLSTARIFRTVGGPLRYRMPQKPKMRRALPAASITNTKKEKGIARTKYHNCQKRGGQCEKRSSPHRGKTKRERHQNRSLSNLGCSDYVFSNSFLEDLERLWELRFIIPDPCNPTSGTNDLK